MQSCNSITKHELSHRSFFTICKITFHHYITSLGATLFLLSALLLNLLRNFTNTFCEKILCVSYDLHLQTVCLHKNAPICVHACLSEHALVCACVYTSMCDKDGMVVVYKCTKFVGFVNRYGTICHTPILCLLQ